MSHNLRKAKLVFLSLLVLTLLPAGDGRGQKLSRDIRPIPFRGEVRFGKFLRQTRALDHRSQLALVKSGQSFERLAAAWELVHRNCHDVKSKEDESGHSVAWFVGFLEGQFKVTPPSYWRIALSNGKFRDGRFYPALPDRTAAQYGIVWSEKCKRWHPPMVQLDWSRDQLTVSQGKESCQVPAELLANEHDGGGLACQFSEEVCYLMTYEKNFPMARSIAAINLDNQGIAWKQLAWGSGASMVSILSEAGVEDKEWKNIVHIDVDPQYVYVFGLYQSSAFFEMFRKKDGARMALFDSNF